MNGYKSDNNINNYILIKIINDKKIILKKKIKFIIKLKQLKLK